MKDTRLHLVGRRTLGVTRVLLLLMLPAVALYPDVLLFAARLMLQEPVHMRVTTRMVEVGVLVHDPKGRPVTGLRVEDFRLFDGGREEQIRSFSAAGPGKRETGGESHVKTAILLDYLNSEFRHEAFGRAELLRFLRELEPTQPVALLALDFGFQVLHDFTTDAASLLGALERYRPYRPNYAQAIQPRLKLSSDSIFGPIRRLDNFGASLYGSARADATRSAIAALSSYLSRTPGRKDLIWISSLFPGALAASVRGDDVAVYPVDVTTPLRPGPSARMLAERTGGVAFDHGNSLLNGIRQAYQDGGAVYVLGYYPSHDQWNGQFRPIQVSLNRPGLELRYRTGYVAAMNEDFRPPDPWETLRYVAETRGEVRGIVVTGKATRLRDGPVELALKLDMQTLPSGDQARKDGLELLSVPLRGDGGMMEGQFGTVELGGAGKPAEHGGLTITIRLTAPPATRRLRVVVRDPRSGALGSATIPLGESK